MSMRSLYPQSLQGRFLIGLMAAMCVMGVFFVVMLRVHTRELLASEAREKANLITSHTEAIQQYVRKTLRPAVAGVIGPDDFIIEAMSTSFVSRHILGSLHIEGGSFEYRRVARNARNPQSEVNAKEKAILKAFLAEPGRDRIEQRVGTGDSERLVVARPVYFTADCMWCHGEPDTAPAVLLDMYGVDRGFGKKAGELAGLDIISVSMESSSSAVLESVTMFGIWFATGMVLLFGAVQGFFSRLVVHNLARVSAILQRLFFNEGGGLSEQEPALAERSSRERSNIDKADREDDIEGMVRSIESVALHLAEARKQLSDYTRNLESMVQERTADLASVAAARYEDVQLFVSLLSGLNQPSGKQGLLKVSLRLLAGHFGARMALYACGVSGVDYAVWPDEAKLELLPEDIGERFEAPSGLLTLEEPELHERYWLLPVQSGGSTRGVLGLFWEEGGEAPDRAPSLAQAFGRQLSIALDNMDALDTLLRQNSLLDSIVEGVQDPLMLMEGTDSVVLANSSARELARSLDNSPVSSLVRHFQLRRSLRNVLEQKIPLHEERSQPGGRSFALGLYPLESQGALLGRAIVHIRETTRERQLLDQMRRSEKLAVVGQLAAGIAHEINNPLGVIRCYAELLGSSATDKQQTEDIQVILHHVDQAQTVLRDLLDFSRPHADNVSECDLGEFVPTMLELFKAKASSAGISLRLAMRDGLPRIRTDKSMLEQVLVNFLLNALDAVSAVSAPSGGGGEITLGAVMGDDGEHVVVFVSDNGPGVDESAMTRIFDPFYTTKSGGTGLGLAVAYGMAQEMGGFITVQNNYQDGEVAGVVFSVLLPVERPDNRPQNLLDRRPDDSEGTQHA